MATLSTAMPTLLDWAKRRDPDGRIAKVVELLSQQNDILKYLTFKEGNLPTGHLVSLRTALPTVAWRLLNQGGAISKSTTAQVTFETGILEAWSEVDCEIAELESDVDGFRASEATVFLEAMNQEVAQTLVYGNQGTAPEEFTGLAPFYNAISGATNASHVISGGGSGSDNSSIYLVVSGPETIFGTFPKGSNAGLVHEDKGKVTVQVSGIGGTRLDVYQDKFLWKPGLVVKDWRYCVRIPNIDISNLIALSSNADLPTLMIKAWHRIPNFGMGRAFWLMNRTCAEMLEIICRTDVRTGGQLSWDTVDGKRITTFRGIPIAVTDALLETEATVS